MTALKLSTKLGVMVCFGTLSKYERLDTKLEKKMAEMKRHLSGHENFRSIDSIILRFPQFREALKEIRGVFEQYDEDSNGIIDCEELKKCLLNLQFHLTEKEIHDLFNSCDTDKNQGIQFNEFIALLCLILLEDYSASPNTVSNMGSPQVESTFNTIIKAFMFLDKKGVGKLNKKDVVKAFNEASPWERSPSHVTRTRLKELDWDRNGKVSFREFLFALVDWVGVHTDDEIPVT